MVRTGLDRWVAEGFAAIRGKKVGAIVNPTSVDSRMRHLADLLANEPRVKLEVLFAPEHGIRGEAQYMVAVDEAKDARTGVPAHSLYGSTVDSLSPKPEWLDGIDALVFDIQDVGSRYYTYVYTMALAMKEAARAGVAFYVLDRPNPIGGTQVEGNLVGERYRSFVGLFALPNRHGMTMGELARYLNAQQQFGAELTVAKCEGWRRAEYWDRTGLQFVPPSPNMPTADTALVYPGMCLCEGTNLSEGRGTCRPFEQFGAPWLDSDAVADQLNKQDLPGVRFRPVTFVPGFDKHAGKVCFGAMIHVIDRQLFRPLLTGIAVIQTARRLGGTRFCWRTDPYEFVADIPAFDLLCGTDQVREGIESDWPLQQLVAGFEDQLAHFLSGRSEYELYV
ncbi:MAG TPA: DUF1343 domain-containing protein [Myxococcaceae bacterium]|nr:DUF1343 domain-containing protein [Myxococcaceae bacterium]